MLDLLEYFDEPFGNPTLFLQWLIAGKAREHITVALSGAGGDELFAGYPRYRAMQLSAAIHRVPKPWLRFASRSLARLRDANKSMHLRRARELLDGLDEDPLREFQSWTYYMTEADKALLLRERSANCLPSNRVLRQQYEECRSSPDNRMLQLDVQTFLVDNLLNYTDRMSMAVGMEVRVPFLEADFVQFALNLPMSWKLGWQSKNIMRKTFAQYLAPAIRRGKKRGFNAPLGVWMRDQLDQYFEAARDTGHPLRERLGDDIGATWLTSRLLNADYIDWMRQQHREGRQDLAHELFAVIMFDLWWRKYITGTSPMVHWSAEGSNQ
jgi:asparagine synthase (glutamine-hydrolysing)